MARFNGGDNAGHTVVNPYGTFKLRLTPNGFSNPKTLCVIGAGVVLNLKTLLDEIDMIQGKGIELIDRLWISPRCSVIMPYHPLVEGIYEKVKGGGATGTTGRGIGPVYADKVSYNSLRLSDFHDETVLAEKLRIQLGVKNSLFKSFGVAATGRGNDREGEAGAVRAAAPGGPRAVRDRAGGAGEGRRSCWKARRAACWITIGARTPSARPRPPSPAARPPGWGSHRGGSRG